MPYRRTLPSAKPQGSRRGCVDLQPAPYNLVLPDGTYEGQIRIGLKFIAERERERGRWRGFDR
ncbi:unnamed protein product [Spirodela intermedia]|uniref:Uncharacterized protein n=1 Tax=Spirodela intermedia TaxID=51605 RepID=A0A7I8JUC1_SPIIN|nr:unnamed protein product [Spirodela intermedia]CAA6673355.1 unnamed protein product [Spirodela intermedia]